MAFRAVTVTAILLASVVSAEARQAVQLEFSEGRVNLSAKNAPIRTILAEWARLGGVTVVNGDGVAGPPVTLELASLPERQALDILLRGVSGYMIAPRRAGSTGVSTFDRIMILPTSVAPSAPPVPANAGRPTPQRPPIFGRPPQPEATPVEQPDDVVEEPQDDQEADSNQPPRNVPRLRPPVINPNINTGDADDQEPSDDDVPAVPTAPGNPFGIPAGSSATPGVISPAQEQRPGPARVQ